MLRTDGQSLDAALCVLNAFEICGDLEYLQFAHLYSLGKSFLGHDFPSCASVQNLQTGG